MEIHNGIKYELVETDVPGIGKGASLIAFRGSGESGIDLLGVMQINNSADLSIYLSGLYVKEEVRKNGIGRQLINCALNWNAASNGDKAVWFMVDKKALDLIPYYERCGFQICGQYTGDDGDVLMTKTRLKL